MTISGRLLEVFGSATPGAVPASGGGTTNFLRADGTWAAPAGGGGGGSLTVSAPNKILGRVSAGSGPAEEIDCTAFARTVFDDADAPTAATTLGLGTGSNVTHERLTIATATANQIGATFSGVSLTGANTQAILDLSATWNTTGHANAIKINIANSASGGSSKFLDCQVNGTTLFYAKTSGEVYAQSTVIAGGSTTLIGGSTFGVWTSAGRAISINSDCNWERDSANSMALRNAANAQALGVYNQWVTTTNYERFLVDWKTTPNLARLVTQKGSGGGVARALALGTDDVDRVTIGTNGNVTFSGEILLLGGSSQYIRRMPSDIQIVTYGNGNLSMVGGIGIAPSAGLANDAGINRDSPGVLLVTNGGLGAGALLLKELASDPVAPSANGVVLFARDNGSGKTQYCARFPTGAIQVITTEP